MTDNTQPEAGSTHIIRYALEMGLLWIDGSARDKVREALDALDTLEAQLEAIGAGGVTGPLIGQPQAMPDLSAPTERGAKAWAGVDAQGLRECRWYMLNKDGMATLCADRDDAMTEAASADKLYPNGAPHRALQLVAANAGSEPVVAITALWEAIGYQGAHTASTGNLAPTQKLIDAMNAVEALVTHPSPPEGMAGWRDIATAPKDKTNVLLLRQPCGSVANGFWLAEAYAGNGAWIWPYVHKNPTHWMPAPPLASEAKGVSHE